MVNVDVEVDTVAEVIGGSERAEAPGEGVQAVEGEDLDDEGEFGVRVSDWGSEGEIRVGFGD